MLLPSPCHCKPLTSHHHPVPFSKIKGDMSASFTSGHSSFQFNCSKVGRSKHSHPLPLFLINSCLSFPQFFLMNCKRLASCPSPPVYFKEAPCRGKAHKGWQEWEVRRDHHVHFSLPTWLQPSRQTAEVLLAPFLRRLSPEPLEGGCCCLKGKGASMARQWQ